MQTSIATGAANTRCPAGDVRPLNSSPSASDWLLSEQARESVGAAIEAAEHIRNIADAISGFPHPKSSGVQADELRIAAVSMLHMERLAGIIHSMIQPIESVLDSVLSQIAHGEAA